MSVKTTILLREGVREHFLRKFGPHRISLAINEILARPLFRGRSMLGADLRLTPIGLRDEKEPHDDF